uniref:ankyrin repeat domain-containing protein 60-like n=1 Tax=Styela clava TaxID=7725 RepID=UPI001939810B|nr:ankyrin repeat domain-containing protein 60-like [Styela clava]XP_039255913.1 ankyrin repeat domain-containing protein 60-like [Styela clava]XP_039255914.1 ankyrin repeat domain-containing protein 60-like [Styela clava]
MSNATKEFSVDVLLKETNEVFTVKNVTVQMTVETLKVNLEIIAGIPKPLQRLMYLDEGDMEDNSTLQHHDIVSGAKITMKIWRTWMHLIQACVKGELREVMKLGVTPDSEYQDPNSNFMGKERRIDWFFERQSVALYVSAHRGRVDIMKKLISKGADVSKATKCGRTALHVAAASGQDACVDLLLSYGAGELIKSEDNFGKTPLLLASEWGHKSSERRLFLFQWQVRASQMKADVSKSDKDLMAHQMFDSSLKTHLQGCQSQLYFSNVLPPQEFEGTALESKHSKHYHKILQSELKREKNSKKNGAIKSKAKRKVRLS